MKKQTTNGLRNIITIMLLTTAALSSQFSHASMSVDVSFSAINTFEDRKNAFRISGIDRASGMSTALILYNFAGNSSTSRFSSSFSGGTPVLLADNVRHQRCYDYIMRMLDEPGKFFITFHLQLRDDPNDFSRESYDEIVGCDIERQNPTMPAG